MLDCKPYKKSTCRFDKDLQFLWVVSDCEQLRLKIVLKIESYQLAK